MKVSGRLHSGHVRVIPIRHLFFAAFFFAFGLPRFFGAGGVRSIARTASSKVPLMGGIVVSAFWRVAIFNPE